MQHGINNGLDKTLSFRLTLIISHLIPQTVIRQTPWVTVTHKQSHMFDQRHTRHSKHKSRMSIGLHLHHHGRGRPMPAHAEEQPDLAGGHTVNH